MMERFFGTLKRECPMHFETRQQARGAIFEYIEFFFHRVRRHSVLGYLSPVDFKLSKRSFFDFDLLPKRERLSTPEACFLVSAITENSFVGVIACLLALKREGRALLFPEKLASFWHTLLNGANHHPVLFYYKTRGESSLWASLWRDKK